MSNENIYKKAVSQLFEKTRGRLEDRDEIIVFELFDRLIERGIVISTDMIKQICIKNGYHPTTGGKISQIYDFIFRYRAYKEQKDYPRWNDEIIDGWLC